MTGRDTDDDEPATAPPNMTDDHDETPDEPDDIDSGNPDQFDKKEVHRFGERGSPVVGEENKHTDIEGMTETVDRVVNSFCNCGAAHTDVDEVYRCCHCDSFCCTRCHIEIRRYNYCPNCIQTEYGINKPTYKALYLLDAGIIDDEDLIETETADDAIIELQVSTAAETILDHGYLKTDDDPGDVTTGDTLSANGEEALHVGEQLFGDDPDIEELKEQVRLKKVAGE